jgi:hypothetical protein
MIWYHKWRSSGLDRNDKLTIQSNTNCFIHKQSIYILLISLININLTIILLYSCCRRCSHNSESSNMSAGDVPAQVRTTHNYESKLKGVGACLFLLFPHRLTRTAQDCSFKDSEEEKLEKNFIFILELMHYLKVNERFQ